MKRTTLRSLCLLALATALFTVTGCNTVSVRSQAYLGVPHFAPTDPASVQILHAQPTAAHVRLGEVTLQPQGNPPVTEIEAKLRQSAAQMGANAAVIVLDQTMVMGAVVSGPWWGRTVSPETGRVIVAVAIRITN